MIQFRCMNEDGRLDELQTYNDLLNKIEDFDQEDGESPFTSIGGHYGPLKQSDLEYKGSSWNVKVNWENSDPTYEPLKLIAECDPVTCALYAEKNDLLNTPGW